MGEAGRHPRERTSLGAAPRRTAPLRTAPCSRSGRPLRAACRPAGPRRRRNDHLAVPGPRTRPGPPSSRHRAPARGPSGHTGSLPAGHPHRLRCAGRPASRGKGRPTVVRRARRALARPGRRVRSAPSGPVRVGTPDTSSPAVVGTPPSRTSSGTRGYGYVSGSTAGTACSGATARPRARPRSVTPHRRPRSHGQRPGIVRHRQEGPARTAAARAPVSPCLTTPSPSPVPSPSCSPHPRHPLPRRSEQAPGAGSRYSRPGATSRRCPWIQAPEAGHAQPVTGLAGAARQPDRDGRGAVDGHDVERGPGQTAEHGPEEHHHRARARGTSAGTGRNPGRVDGSYEGPGRQWPTRRGRRRVA